MTEEKWKRKNGERSLMMNSRSCKKKINFQINSGKKTKT